MKWSLKGRLLPVLFLFTLQLTGQNMHFDIDGMAVIQGERKFILGLYEFPKDEKILKEVHEAGFNLIGVTAKDSLSTIQSLDQLAKYHMGAWISGNFDLSIQADKRKIQMKRMAANYAAHPSLYAWEVPDEALWNVTTEAWEYKVRQEIKLMRKNVAAMKDSSNRAVLISKIDAIVTAYYNGEYEAGQKEAEKMMKLLGMTPGNPQIDLTRVLQKTEMVAKGIEEGYKFMKSLDPQRPIFMNHAPRNQPERLASFSQWGDMIGCDIYPVPEYLTQHSDLADLSLSCVGNYTRRMAQAAAGKPVWMVLQGFGWCDLRIDLPEDERQKLRQPNLKETRFMAWDAIVNGARGINYWGTYLISKEGQLWKDLLTVARELSDLQPILSAKDGDLRLTMEVEENFNSFDRPIRMLQKKSANHFCLALVNENQNRSPVFFTVKGLDHWNGKFFKDQVSGKKSQVVNGAIRLTATGQAVLILLPEE